MKSYHLLLLALLLAAISCTFTNTTNFWKTALNSSGLHYECYSGYEEIDWYYAKGKSAMYYSLFSASGHSVTEENQRVPLMIWLQGGPGSSSQFGAFTELGPIRISKNGTREFANSWNILGHTLFIDQPLNVGFSYSSDSTKPQVSSARIAGDHLVNFLFKFYTQWPTLKKSPLYITGQSFAGHYIPSFGSKLLANKTFLSLTGVKLAGVAIGDGWTDPEHQINYYDSYLYSVGIVSNKFRDTCTWFQTQAIHHIVMTDYKNATQYFDFLTNNDQTRAKYWGGMSTYNFRHYHDPDMTFATFLENNKAALGVPAERHYISANDKIYDAFQTDISRAYVGDVITLLKSGTKVLIYNGQDDFVVNTAGVLTYLNSLNWAGIPQWKRTRKEIWTIHGSIRGWAKVSANLWFVLVNGAGHMVPTDQPEAAFNMMGHFIYENNNWKE